MIRFRLNKLSLREVVGQRKQILLHGTPSPVAQWFISIIPDKKKRKHSPLGFAWSLFLTYPTKVGPRLAICLPPCPAILSIQSSSYIDESSPCSKHWNEINAILIQNMCTVLAQPNITWWDLPWEHSAGHRHLLWDQTLALTQLSHSVWSLISVALLGLENIYFLLAHGSTRPKPSYATHAGFPEGRRFNINPLIARVFSDRKVRAFYWNRSTMLVQHTIILKVARDNFLEASSGNTSSPILSASSLVHRFHPTWWVVKVELSKWAFREIQPATQWWVSIICLELWCYWWEGRLKWDCFI